MTYIDILVNFETEIGMIDNTLDKPTTDESLFWLNQAVAKFIKLRFNGDAAHSTGFEETEKRRVDLMNLYETVQYSTSQLVANKANADYNYYTIEHPSNFLFALNEDVIICDTKGDHMMNTCVFECTQDSFMYRINNSLTDFHYRFHRARPIRIRTTNGCKLLTDKNYNITQYTLGYIRTPNELTLTNPYDEYTDFEDTIVYEIIKIAAQMYLENKSNERYKTISAEVLTQE